MARIYNNMKIMLDGINKQVSPTEEYYGNGTGVGYLVVFSEGKKMFLELSKEIKETNKTTFDGLDLERYPIIEFIELCLKNDFFATPVKI